MSPSRHIYCQDAIKWMSNQKIKYPAVLTSIPEMEELQLNIIQYESFFRNAVSLCLSIVKDTGYCIFTQTDRKYHGWIDKGYWITDEATKANYRMIWKKIVLNTEPDTVSLFRPSYSHMLCFTKKGSVGKALPDVISSGKRTYKHGFGTHAIDICIKYLKNQQIKTVVDPFVGSGTTLAIANLYGLNAIGIDNNQKQCKKAKTLKISMKAMKSMKKNTNAKTKKK